MHLFIGHYKYKRYSVIFLNRDLDVSDTAGARVGLLVCRTELSTCAVVSSASSSSSLLSPGLRNTSSFPFIRRLFLRGICTCSELCIWSWGIVVLSISFHFSFAFFLLSLCSIFGCFRIGDLFCFPSLSFKFSSFGFLRKKTVVRTGSIVTDNVVYGLETYYPPKSEALAYLDNSAAPPAKFSRVTIHHGGVQAPVVVDYLVGPLPVGPRTTIRPLKEIYHRDDIPFNARGFCDIEEISLFLARQVAPMAHVMEVSIHSPAPCY